MSEQERPERPPTSGPGSGVAAWRAYAAAVTGSPVESWGALSREDIIATLEGEGVEQSEPDTEATDAAAVVDEQPVPEEPETHAKKPARRRRPVWMVPTDDGMVPEHELRQRGR